MQLRSQESSQLEALRPRLVCQAINKLKKPRWSWPVQRRRHTKLDNTPRVLMYSPPRIHPGRGKEHPKDCAIYEGPVNERDHHQILHKPREPFLFHCCVKLSKAFGPFPPKYHTGLRINRDLCGSPTPLMPWPVKTSSSGAFRYTRASRPLNTPWTLQNDFSDW